MLFPREGLIRSKASLAWIAPHRPANVLHRLPVVPRPHMRMQVGIRVSEDFVIRPSRSIDALNSLAQQAHVEEKISTLSKREISQVRDLRNCEEDAVTRKKLRIS